jgi:uncharacterized protein with NAD-binding domain and iron-sulfur cluster
MSERPIRVAVVGGGCAALTAAFELTQPHLAGRFEVVVYQMGFRLGGKGASGRGKFLRIEEHGLHLWMGYYENAFRLMRQCYAEWNQPHPVCSFEDAFFPAHFNAAMDRSPSGKWAPWKVEFPIMPGMPGDPAPPRLGVAEYLKHAIDLLQALFRTLATDAEPSKTYPKPNLEQLSADQLKATVERIGTYSRVVGLGGVLEALQWLALVMQTLDRHSQSLVARLIDAVADLIRRALARTVAHNDEARRLWEVADLILATARGVVRYRIAFHPRGFDAIDDYDCREWLLLNGASHASVNSAFIRALYDLAFAYAGGDPNKPAIAAGSALRGAFRAFFSYRGAFFWKMNGGMGDVVFAPLYEVLKRRGVRFEFFHRLKSLELATPSTHVAGLNFEVQARIKGDQEYLPLIDVMGKPCWPAQPDHNQLVDGEPLRNAQVGFEDHHPVPGGFDKRLLVGQDFDFVVLGIGLGAVAETCASIVRHDERWRLMVENVKSVPTQAFQVWLRPTVHALGWKDEAVNLSGFVEPFDTWADMTHLSAKECWPTRPGTIAYFCNVLPESAVEGTNNPTPEQRHAAHLQVRANCLRFLNRDIQELWPNAVSNGEFMWDWLARDDGDENASFDSQYWTANVSPSDRYSQALPGTTKYRLSPLDPTYDNLTLAGDWTSCGINMGCVEAAVMSGRLAAHALSGSPRLEDITGYDHP